MKDYHFDKETVLKLCKKNDVKVIENGTGQFLADGKPIDPIEVLKKELEQSEATIRWRNR